jgi:Tfp pilus assembly protein PilO
MTQKTKNIVLVSGFVLLLLIAYKFAFAKTIDTKIEYNTLKKEAVVFDNLPTQLSTLKRKEKYNDSILTLYQLNGNSIQNSMLKMINTYAEQNNIKVSNFTEPHQIERDDLKINTYQFSLEGSYNEMITLIHELEQNTKFGEIINLDFKKKKNFKTGKYYLQASVLLKSFG